MRRVRAFVLFVLPLVLVTARGVGPVSADDVPETARKDYQAALDHLAKGDAKKAFSAISKAKEKAGLSLDFWEAFVRIWRANGKPENTLWDTVIAKRAAEAPGTAVFDLLRARLEADPAKKEEHLRAAIAKDAKAVAPRLLLARLLVAQAKDDEADEILDAVLAEQPENEDALVLKAEMELGGGFARSAVEFAEERLAKKESPALRHLLARAYLKLSENDASLMDKAVENARKAVDGRPDPDFVATLADLLDRKGDLKGATALLEAQVAKSPSPLLSGMLGGFALRSGSYETAARNLAESARSNPAAARAMAVSLARIGKSAEAKAALSHVLELEKDALEFVAVTEGFYLGETASARKRLEGQRPKDPWILLFVNAHEGGVAEVTRVLGEWKPEEGSRSAEQGLTLLLLARGFQKLGPKAADVRKRFLESRWKAGRSGVASATRPENEPNAEAHSAGFMRRFVEYRRCVCGPFFQAGDWTPIAPTVIDGKMALGQGVFGVSNCPGDEQRIFPFNAKVIEGEGKVTITFEPNDAVWAEASKAFVEGAAAATREDAAAADAAFTKALEQEGAWAAAKLLRAAVRILGATGDAAAAAKEAREAAAGVPDEFDLRRLSVVVRLLAGDDVAAELDALALAEESFSPRKMGSL